MTDIDLYLFSLDEEVKIEKGWRSLVHPDDSKMALSRFGDVSLQEKFLFQRFFLRKTLSFYIGARAWKDALSFSEKGKPYFLNSPWNFSLSHVGSLFLIGVGNVSSLGVDLEKKRESLCWEGLAEWVLTPQELKNIYEYPIRERKNLFYLLWVKKEAYSKRLGCGFTEDPRKWEIGFLPIDSLNGIYSFNPLPCFFAAISYSSVRSPRIRKCNF